MKLFFLILFAFVSLNAEQRKAMETVVEEQTPPHLYKILSMRSWQVSQQNQAVFLTADDNAFIHLSKEDQLDRILHKYWADAPEYVVLKLESNRLRGDLVYEANPGGDAKYYHLYHGCIPWDSIVEARVVFQQRNAKPTCVPITEIGEPVLRQKAKALTRDEILSPKIQELIATMRETMRAAPGVGLAAPQIGIPLQIAVIEDMDHSHLSEAQIKERDRNKFPFQVLINPKLILEEGEPAEFFEACLSVPNFLGVVPRAKKVRVECLDEHGNPVVIQAKGWHARILQHEIDHLNGILFIDRAKKNTFMTQEKFMQLWRTKPVAEVLANLTECAF